MPSDFFDVVDSEIPSCWTLSCYLEGGNEATTLLTSDEWSNDPCFYEKLIDGDDESVRIFAEQKKFSMELKM